MPMNFDKDQLYAAFKKHADDRGKADTLNLVEFGEMLIELIGHDAGYGADEIKFMFNGIKGDDDELTFDEMWNAITAKPITKKQLEATFKEYDADGSGFLTKAEIADIFAAMPNNPGAEVVEATLAEADANDDDKVSYEEFVALWKE